MITARKLAIGNCQSLITNLTLAFRAALWGFARKLVIGNYQLLITNLTLLTFFAGSSAQSASPSRGLWVGEIVLTNVNEVTTAVNAQNVLVSPNPTNTTPTASAAHLRLILH